MLYVYNKLKLIISHGLLIYVCYMATSSYLLTMMRATME